MKRVNASRPGLSLPTRRGVLALATLGGVVATTSILAKQNILSDKELRQELMKAQLAAKKFTEALQSAQDDPSLQAEVLSVQTRVEGLDAMLKNTYTLSPHARSTALARVAIEYAEKGDTATTERIIPQVLPTSHAEIYPSLVSAYYKGEKLNDALRVVQRMTASSRATALSQLWSSCLTNKDILGVRRVLEAIPAEDNKIVTIADFEQMLAVLRENPAFLEPSELTSAYNLLSPHDLLILKFLYRFVQENPSQAKALAQRLLQPECRKRILADLAARHP